VKKCVDNVVQGVNPKVRPKRTSKEKAAVDLRNLKFHKEGALFDSKCRTLITG